MMTFFKKPQNLLWEWLAAIPVVLVIYYIFDDIFIGIASAFFLIILHHYLVFFKKIQKSNEQMVTLKKLMEGIKELPIGLCICDTSGSILWKNNKIDDYFKSSALQDKSNILKLFNQKDSKFLTDSVNSDRVMTLEIQTDQYVEYSIVDLPDSGYYLVYMRDISDRIYLENSRKIFFGNISHELRIPLTVLKGYIEILENERKQQKYEKSDLKPYKNMQTQVDRLLNMVNQLLTLTKIEGNPFFEDKKVVDMPDIIYSIYDEAQVRNSNKQKISLYLDDELMVKGHDQSLREVVSNLVYNAIEHNPKNSEIEIHWEKAQKDGQDYAMFSIKDNGTGISKEHINRLTERFYVVNSARNRGSNKNVGSGLGLAIVKNALKMHDSELIVESEKNKGSCFKFYLPAYQEVVN
ncbi:MAG: ATP-binding protein [Neisseriaceae bacterium]|nr:ATP-binding protein [Neisseriaceae bacterium]